MLNPTAMAFSVMADQSGTTQTVSGDRSNYNLSDLLTAKSTNANSGWSKGNIVSLQFSHALAMVQVSVPSEGKGFGPGEDLKVTLRGVKAKAMLNLSAASDIGGSGVTLAADDNNAGNITMHRVEKPGDANFETSFTYRALVPAQEVLQGHNLLCFEHEGRQLFQDMPLNAPLAMEAGQAETFGRTLPATLVHTVPVTAGRFMMGSSDGSAYGTGTPGEDLNATLTSLIEIPTKHSIG